MASSVNGLLIGGEGREAEIDGAYFGAHVRRGTRCTPASPCDGPIIRRAMARLRRAELGHHHHIAELYLLR